MGRLSQEELRKYGPFPRRVVPEKLEHTGSTFDRVFWTDKGLTLQTNFNLHKDILWEPVSSQRIPDPANMPMFVPRERWFRDMFREMKITELSRKLAEEAERKRKQQTKKRD